MSKLSEEEILATKKCMKIGEMLYGKKANSPEYEELQRQLAEARKELAEAHFCRIHKPYNPEKRGALTRHKKELQRWIAECCERIEGHRERHLLLYQSYNAWAMKPMYKEMFEKAMNALGYPRADNNPQKRVGLSILFICDMCDQPFKQGRITEEDCICNACLQQHRLPQGGPTDAYSGQTLDPLPGMPYTSLQSQQTIGVQK